MTSFVNVNKRLSSFKQMQGVLILCGNIMSLFSKISYFVWTGKVYFQLREHYFQKAGFFDSLKCSQFSFNSGHFEEMILLALKTGRKKKRYK